MNKYKHIIWDWNGTLINDVWLAVEIMNSILASRNIPLISHEKHKEMFDFPIKNYYQKLGIDFNKELFENALALSDVKLRECLIPRREIEGMESGTPVEVVKNRFIETNPFLQRCAVNLVSLW